MILEIAKKQQKNRKIKQIWGNLDKNRSFFLTLKSKADKAIFSLDQILKKHWLRPRTRGGLIKTIWDLKVLGGSLFFQETPGNLTGRDLLTEKMQMLKHPP